jgi:transketolase
MASLATLAKIAKRLRIHCLKMTTAAGSGHPTSCLSAAEITACLFFDEMRFNRRDPHDPANDEFVLSKGHAAPLLWALYAESGLVPMGRLKTLRQVTSDLEGHPTPRMKWVKAATGSLGQGLSIGAGLALAQRFQKSPGRTFVLLGDGECAEGNVWEAANFSGFAKLKNLCAIVDVNGLGQSDWTMFRHDAREYARRFAAYGWDTHVIDGHDLGRILEAFRKTGKAGKPTAILARTIKGKGVPLVEDKNGWHGKALDRDQLKQALKEIGPMPEVDAARLVRKPRPYKKTRVSGTFEFASKKYAKDTATRAAYGDALAALGRVHPLVVAVDGDVRNSTRAEQFFEDFPKRSIESYICEQNMIAMGVGLSARGYLPFVATFAAFLTRAHDQIRMAAVSFANLKFCGSHAGVSIGEDGPSQMGLEDLAMFRAVPGCVVLYPSDAYSAVGCVASLASHRGLGYIRTTRPKTPVIYGPRDKFPIGGCKVLGVRNGAASVAVIAAGVTVREALKAQKTLGKDRIGIQVIDAYSVAPLDKLTILREVKAAGGRALVVEDHYEGGGLGDAVAQALAGEAALKHLCVRKVPRSGKEDELLAKYEIDEGAIVKAIKEWLGR